MKITKKIYFETLKKCPGSLTFTLPMTEVIKVISSLFYEKNLQAKKSTKTHMAFLNTA